MEQLSFDDLKSGTWMGFTWDHDRGAAVLAFVLRYGQQPFSVLESRGLLLVGPIPVDAPQSLLGFPVVPGEVLR